MWKILRYMLFRLDPEWAHELGAVFLRLRGLFTQGNAPVVRVLSKRQAHLCGYALDSPVGVAAGFDKDGKLFLGLRSLGFGFVEVGSVTPRPQAGNPKPRLFRVPEAHALINRMGFNSEGAEEVAARIERTRALVPVRFPLGINLGKNRETPLERAADDYVAALQTLYSVADYLVINLSSPNTPGLTSLQEGDSLRPLLAAVREARDRKAAKDAGLKRPLFLKLSPDLSREARRIAVEAAMEQGFEGLIASNTSRRRDFPELHTSSAQLVAESGGLSGRPLREDALRHIQEVRSLVGNKAILISVGGLGDSQDARERLEAGADLLQVYTEFVYQGPGYPRRLALDLARP
jgi:dihydroorotate dehydrogenase